MDNSKFSTDKEAKEAIGWLEKMANDTGTFCAAAMELYCDEDNKCKDHCKQLRIEDGDYCKSVQDISSTSDWNDEFGCDVTEYCPLPPKKRMKKKKGTEDSDAAVRVELVRETFWNCFLGRKFIRVCLPY